MSLRPTQRLNDGRYVLLGLLRTGGEAEVWRALDTASGQERALKVWLAADGGADAAARELALARRVAHPHVVRVDDAFVDGDHAFVVMELAEGSLAERVATLGPLTPDEAFAALEGPLAALEAAHAAGVVHRDVKPHNLLVFGALDGRFDGGDGPRAVVKLGDFGIAQVRAEGLTRTRSGAFLGSLPFMSPEQRRDPKRVGPATDVYAAAVTLAWLVTGKAPGDLYLPETLAELRGELRGRRLAHGEVERVVGVVEAGGRLEAERRVGVTELVGAGRGVGGRPSGGRARRWRMAWLAAGSGAAMAVAGTVWTAALRTSSGAPHDASVEATVPPCGDTVTQWVEDVRMGPRETTSAALSDVDADGVLDALFTNQMDESVTIWWGQKGALPRENVTVATGRAYAPVAVGDIDGDANADLVLALQDDSAFAIVPGRGRRTFGEPSRIFQSPPPVSAALLDVNGDERLDIVYNEFFSNINVRTRAAGSWAPHRKALGLNPATSVAGIVRALPSPRLLLDERGRLLDRTLDGTQQHGHDQLTRWVPGPLGTDQAFAVHSSGQLVRVATGGGLCAIGPYTAPWQPAAMGDIDQDGVLDVIALDSCRECTSNHVFLHGIAATGPGSPP